jgi:hypothetical protein
MIREGCRAASTRSVGETPCHRPAVPDWEIVTGATRLVRQDVSEERVHEAALRLLREETAR